MVDGPDSAWRNRAPGPHRITARQAMGGLWTEVDSKNSQTTRATTSTTSIRQLLGAADAQNGTPCHIQHSPNTPTTGLRERRNDTSKSTSRSGRQKAATRRNMQREERVTVQGPVKEQQPDGMSHRGGLQYACASPCSLQRTFVSIVQWIRSQMPHCPCPKPS